MPSSPTDFKTLDPFHRVVVKIWELLEKHDLFKQRVPKGNRIKYHEKGDRSPDKDNPATADHPLVRVMFTGFDSNLFDTSGGGMQGGTKGSSTIVGTFNVEIHTGDQRTPTLTKIVYAVLAAMSGTRDGDDRNLALNFVTDLRISGGANVDPRFVVIDKPINEWRSIVQIVVTMALDNELELQA